MNELYLSKAKEILDEWEGDVLELDYKISNREIPEHDNADAKMKIELWFGLQSTLQYIEALKGYEHDTDGLSCWCRPTPIGDNVWVHKKWSEFLGYVKQLEDAYGSVDFAKTCMQRDQNKTTHLKEENELVKLLVTGRVKGEWPDGMNGDPDEWEEWSLQLYGHEAGDLLLGQEAWDHIARGLKREPA